MSLQPPFALFITAKEIDVDYINESLTRAWKGNCEASWELWVATDRYEDAPNVRNDNQIPEASEAPISKNFTSPFVGKTLEDCAKWLQQAPSDLAFHKQYFTAMDEHSKAEHTVMLCRIVEYPKSRNIELEYFPQETDTIVMNMATNGGSKFDEKAWNYRASRMKDGKPDRSNVKAGP